MQEKNNTHLNTAQWLTLSTIYMLCYWPTYFILSIDPAVMQKSHFIVMFVYLITITLCTRTQLIVPNIAYVYLLPLGAMLIAFSFAVAKFSAFHISVLIKPILLFFYVVFITSLLYYNFTVSDNKWIKKNLNTIFLLQILIIVFQIIFGDTTALKVLSFKEVYTGFGFRAPGTFDWVYVTCYFLNFFLALHLIEFYLGYKRKTAAIYILFSLIAIFLSQSKTGYIATIFVALYFIFLSIILQLKITKKIIVAMVVTLSLFVSCIIYLDLNLDYITTFIDLMQQGQLDGSTSTRKAQTITAVTEGLTHWYKGSPMALQGLIIENSYLDYLFRYGLFGLIAFTSIIVIFYFYSLHICMKTKKRFHQGYVNFETFQLSVACHVSLFVAPLYSFSGTPLDGYRSSIWSCFIIALITYIDLTAKKEKS